MQKFLKDNKIKIFLFFIILIGASFRLYGINWDQGYHLHPDERAIIMFTTPLEFPQTISKFLSSQSSWNPHFFAYGSFPIYLLKIAGNIASIGDPVFAAYDKINLLGRFLSAIFDIGTLVVLFFLAKKLFNQSVGILAAFLYAVSVLPIQLSHFYAVDTPLTFFVLLTLYQLIKLYEHPTRKNALLVGIFFGLSLGTKTSALVLLSSIGVAIAIDFLLIFLKQPHHPHVWFPHVPIFIKRLSIDGVIIVTTALATFALVEPYAFIDFQEFWKQNMQQKAMTRDAFTFPYTLQYVGKIPYWYELRNIFLWGLGPLLATFSFFGTLYVSFRLMKKHLGWWQKHQTFDSSEVDKKWAQELIVTVFFWVYFLVVGNFAIGFMRYLLPIYPLLCLFSAVFIYHLSLRVQRSNLKSIHALRLVGMTGGIVLLLFWPLMFLHIYTKPNTRVIASEWINQNIPSGATIAIEHWDDALPLFGQQSYNTIVLQLYDPDTTQKWSTLNTQVSQADYIIIASNRLYTPLMRLTNCQILPNERCYPQTSQYYTKLFDGSLGFTKTAEFTLYPKLEIGNWKLEINDSSADESFTVYDHPKILIFKREE